MPLFKISTQETLWNFIEIVYWYIVQTVDGIIKTQHGRQCLNVEMEDICWLFVLPVLHVNIHTLPHGNNKP